VLFRSREFEFSWWFVMLTTVFSSTPLLLVVH